MHARMRRAALVLLAGCSLGDEPQVVSADEPLPSDLAPGDLIQRAGIEVAVPAAGEQVQLVGELEDGTSIELTVRTSLDGIPEVIGHELVEPVAIAASATAPCQDGAFTLGGHAWSDTYRWRFQAGSTPSGNSKDNVETALRHAASAITTSRNDCGLADQVSAMHTYLGRTSAAPNIRSANGVVSCGAKDGTNTAGFGTLPPGFLAVACTWTDGNGRALEGDVKFNTRYRWFALGVPSGCENRFGVQAVGTHEFGHVFGLGHVSESTHPNLTMSTAARACSNAPLSLGLGDVRALRRLY